MAEQVSVDQRAAELDQREAKLDQREAELDQRAAELNQLKAVVTREKDKVCADRADLRKREQQQNEKADEHVTICDILDTREHWLSQQEAEYKNMQIAIHELTVECAQLTVECAQLTAECAQLTAECAQLTAKCARKRKGATRKKNAWPSAHVQEQLQSSDTKRLAALEKCMINVTKAATTVAAGKDALAAEKAAFEAENAALKAEKAALKAEKAMVTRQLVGLVQWRLELDETAARQTRCDEAMATLRKLLDDMTRVAGEDHVDLA